MLFISVILLASVLTFVQGNPGAQETPGLAKQIAGKDLSELLDAWPDQYVRWIITKGERSLYKSLETDLERLQFMEAFWARRDPTPETLNNEYRADYLERFAFVANRFSAGKPGWATDRGRMYLLLGPPHAVQRNPYGRSGVERPSEIWTYNNLDLPNMPASIDIQFVDFKGTGDFEIVADIDTTAPLWTQFGAAVESSLEALALRRDRIGEVDQQTGLSVYKHVDGTGVVMQEFDLQQQLREIGKSGERAIRPMEEVVESRATFRRLSVQATAGAVHVDERSKVPVSIAVPYRELSARREGGKVFFEVDYLIRVLDEDGTEIARVGDELTLSFEDQQYGQLASQRLAIEEALEVEPGSYTLLAYVRDRLEEKVGSVERPLEVPKREPQDFSLSSIFLAQALADSIVGSSRPFQFGTVRVIPNLESSFRSDQNLSLYLEAYGAAESDDGRKRIRVDFFIMKEGRLFMGVPAHHLFPHAEPIGITASIPLRKCTTGDYVIRVRVTDEVTGRRAERDASFAVIEESGPVH